eukprot:6200414-Pleurochrysis_carterae.AAC.2
MNPNCVDATKSWKLWQAAERCDTRRAAAGLFAHVCSPPARAESRSCRPATHSRSFVSALQANGCTRKVQNKGAQA